MRWHWGSFFVGVVTVSVFARFDRLYGAEFGFFLGRLLRRLFDF